MNCIRFYPKRAKFRYIIVEKIECIKTSLVIGKKTNKHNREQLCFTIPANEAKFIKKKHGINKEIPILREFQLFERKLRKIVLYKADGSTKLLWKQLRRKGPHRYDLQYKGVK